MIIREQSNLRLFWDVLILILIIVSCSLIPYQLAFVHLAERVNNGLMHFIGAVFLVDIGLNFMTSYRQGGSEVLDAKKIRQHYLKGLFTVDLVANLPLGLLLTFTGDFMVSGFSAILLVRMLGLLRLVRFLAILRRWEAFSWTHPGYLRVFKYVGMVLVLTHCIACLWFAMAYIDDFPADSWVVAAGIDGSDVTTQYVRSLYWTITTMTTVGYGDISPGRNAEYLLATVIMLIGASLYAFIIGGVASLIGNLQAAKNTHWEHMESVEQYLRVRRVPASIGTQVHNYYEYLWHRHKGLNERSLLSDIPESLRLDIMLHLARDVLQQVPLFRYCSPALRNRLLVALNPATYAPGNYLVREGDTGKNIIFITRGEVDVIAGNDDTHFATMGVGDYFGHLSLALLEQRSGSVRARDYCEVLILDKSCYDEISAEYPDFMQVMKKVSAEYAEKSSELLMEGIVL
jgi:hypothetical protein